MAATRELSGFLLLALVVIFAGIREPSFLQPRSISSILQWSPLLLVVGLGEMAVIVTRGIDISVGSIVGLSAMAVGMLLRAHPTMNVFAAALMGAGVGLGLGSLNGVFVALAKVPPIIATLGTFTAYRGLIFILSGGRQVDSNDIPDALTRWSLAGPFAIGGVLIPWILVFALVLSLIAAYGYTRTRTGRDLFALGSNPDAALLRGVPVRRTTFLAYALSGALCGLAGSFYLSRYGFANPSTAGQGLELMVIASVVIGGTNVKGGTGSVLGVALGCLLLGAINVALSVLGIAESWQQLVYGAVILVAVVVDSGIKRLMEPRLGAV